MSRLLVAVVFAHTYVFVHGAQDMYYKHNNMTCIQCQPGQFWIADCSSDGGSAECASCPEGTYTFSYNLAQYCRPCRTGCKNVNLEYEVAQREEIVQECTSTSDLLCQCKEGYWRESEPNGVCRTATACGQGLGVKTIANEKSDTICEDCDHGVTFSNVTSAEERCRPCSTCGTDAVLERPCTRTEDTVCAIRTTRDGKKLAMGLGIGISVFVCLAFGIGMYAFLRSRRAKENISDRDWNVEGTNIGNDIEPLANGNETERQANKNAAHGSVDEADGQANWNAANDSADEADRLANGNAGHAHGAQANENFANGAAAENGVEEIGHVSIDNGNVACATPDRNEADVQMQKVYSDMSAEMDGSYKSFFRRNSISDTTISVIEAEERRVCEQCYKLFRAWGQKQTGVHTLPTMEIPLELIRRLQAMFQEDTVMNCTQTCLDILKYHENKWIQQIVSR